MNRLKDYWGLATVIILIGILYSFLPLGTALQFGGDEGYQLMTGFMMSKGYKLYEQIWNDQPPIHVLLLNGIFKQWGPSILLARLMSAGFGLLLFGSFFEMVRRRINIRAAFIATFLLLSSPVILEISVSVMQEVPAFALALVSVLILFRWREKLHWSWLIASGSAMGIALGIKLTAILVMPAMFVELALAWRDRNKSAWLKSSLKSVTIWTTALILVLGSIQLIWGRGSVASSWKSHFAEHYASDMGLPEDYPMPASVFTDHAEVVIAASAGLLLALRRKRWRELAFPAIALFTALVVHSVHRPWWMYYYLHLAIPMTWLAGYALNEAIAALYERRTPVKSGSRRPPLQKSKWGIPQIVCITLASLVLVRSEKRLEAGAKDLHGRERIADNPIIAKMKEYGPQTHWTYVHYGNEIYAFHAQLPMPPEITMVTLKRYWSGQISTAEIVETCRRYKTEQILFQSPLIADEWTPFLKSDYSIVYQANRFQLYTAKWELKPNGSSGTRL